MTENVSNLWLKRWLFYSLNTQLFRAESSVEPLLQLSQSLPAQPLIIGISGAQGSGKSTLAESLKQLWSSLGVQTEVLSLDDYYLEPAKRAERAKLWHPLFNERGVPGTHDTELLLSQLRQFSCGEAQKWRRYDKGTDSISYTPQASEARLLILEGWCVGLEAQPEHELLPSINKLEQQQDSDSQWRRQVNQQLAGDYQQIWQELDCLIWLNAPNWQAVCRWRAWQEHALQQQGRGKSPAELAHFMLYFQRLTQQGWRQLPQRADFILTLDEQHNLVKLTPDV